MYTVKLTHITLALLSVSGFTLRGIWMLTGSPLLDRRWVRVAPHIIDTALLLTGVLMVVRLHIYPTQQPWLAAKLVALVLYVVAGSIALRRGRSRRVRVVALLTALACVSYMLAAALTHRPLLF